MTATDRTRSALALEIVVFVAGAVVMMLEIAGARVLAPYLGTSIVTWTSIIGVILASLSGGYFFGGKLADRGASMRSIAQILAWASAAVLMTAMLKDWWLIFLSFRMSVHAGSVIASCVLFAPASFLLGMIAPYAAKIALTRLESSGATVGTLYALSAVGSIAGTFLTGFFLLAWLGNMALLILLSLLLLLTSFLAQWKSAIVARTLLGIAIVIAAVYTSTANAKRAAAGTIIFDTRYNWFLVKDTMWREHANETPRPIRLLTTHFRSRQSGIYLDSGDEFLVFLYTRYFRLVDHFRPDARNALLLGGGAFTVARDFLARHPDARIDAVEIDDALPNIAIKHFGLNDDPRLALFTEDARVFMNRAGANSYDAIFVDVFGNSPNIPYHLTTRETVAAAYRLLADGGVVIVNLVSPLEGPDARFFVAEYATYRSVFPQVYVFKLTGAPRGQPQNLVFVALKSARQPAWQSKDAELNGYLARKIDVTVPKNATLLTDDFAPVDQYMANVNF